jgi:hypothetical protein
MKLDPMHIDLSLYALIVLCGAWATILGTDEAAKYIAPATLFWVRGAIGSLGLAATAVKTFRSQSFADYVRKKGDTEMLTRAQAGLGPLHK